MKRNILLTFTMLTSILFGYGQEIKPEISQNGSFLKSDLFVSVGVPVLYFESFTYSKRVPPVLVYADYQLNDFVTAGAFTGYQWFRHANNTSSEWFFGARSNIAVIPTLNRVLKKSYHSQQFHPYLSIMAGAQRHQTQDNDGELVNGFTKFAGGLVVGSRLELDTRYYLFGEAGIGTMKTFLNIGAGLKL